MSYKVPRPMIVIKIASIDNRIKTGEPLILSTNVFSGRLGLECSAPTGPDESVDFT